MEFRLSKVGFPIRKFTDQSLFAAPHDLSQRTTSFFASQRQGIHRTPLRHLIALIIDVRVSATLSPKGDGQRSKDHCCFKRTRERRGQAAPTFRRPEGRPAGSPRPGQTNDPCGSIVGSGLESRMHFLFTMSDNFIRAVVLRTARNLSFPGRMSQKPAAIAPSGGARRDRTDDLMLAKHALSQLSYGPF